MKKILTITMGIAFATILSVPTLSLADNTLIGKQCFALGNGYNDTWEWQMNMIAPDVYTLTGYDSSAHCAMTGGGQIDPTTGMLLLTVQSSCSAHTAEEFPMYGSLHLILDIESSSGTANLAWFMATDPETIFDYSLRNIPFDQIDCPCLCNDIAKPSIVSYTNSKLKKKDIKEYKIHSSRSY